MARGAIHRLVLATSLLTFAAPACSAQAVQITRGGEPAQLDIRPAADHAIRVTLKPLSFEEELPFTPSLAADRSYPDPVISLREMSGPVEQTIGNLRVIIHTRPLSVEVRNAAGHRVQKLVFEDSGKVSFDIGGSPVLGMGEGGPQSRSSWQTDSIEFDRR
ncbi:MAG TPA: hypothetical protein VIQ60_08525, partial [Gemmatimonadaceae bacterium]